MRVMENFTKGCRGKEGCTRGHVVLAPFFRGVSPILMNVEADQHLNYTLWDRRWSFRMG